MDLIYERKKEKEKEKQKTKQNKTKQNKKLSRLIPTTESSPLSSNKTERQQTFQPHAERWFIYVTQNGPNGTFVIKPTLLHVMFT